MPVYTSSNGAIVADLTALRAIASTDLPASGFVVLLVASENSWFEYNPALTSGDTTPINNPTTGRWLRIGRDKLTANRTYFVRTDGSDTNNGLANTAGGAFVSLAKFYLVLSTLDKNGFAVTCQLASGTHTLTATVNVTDGVGFGSVTVTGATATASDCVIQSTNIQLLSIQSVNNAVFQNLTLSVLSSDYKECIVAFTSSITLKNIAFLLASNGVGVNAYSNSIVNAEALAFSGAGYVGIGLFQSIFNYKRGTSMSLNASLGFTTLQGEGGVFDFFNVDFNGTGTKNYVFRGYSKIIFLSGKSLTGTATDSIVLIL